MFRKITSLTLLLSGALLLLTSVVLYIEPHGRVAFWADWHLAGLSKTQWDAVHVTTGLLFTLAAAVHLYLNWRPVVTYFRDRSKEITTLSKPFLISLFITLYVSVGTLTGLPPMKQVMDLNEFIKNKQARIYGNPPYGHAELSSLAKLAGYTNLNPDKALATLRQNGLNVVSRSQSLKEIAFQNHTTPQRVFEIMLKSKSGENPFAVLPERPPAGTGKARIEDFCKQFDLPLDKVLLKLESRKISARKGMTFKEISLVNGMKPVDVYEAIRK